jgi:hypothetical protein
MGGKGVGNEGWGGGEGGTMPYMDLERLTFYIDYETLKVQKNEIFFGFDFEICNISLLVMSKY